MALRGSALRRARLRRLGKSDFDVSPAGWEHFYRRDTGGTISLGGTGTDPVTNYASTAVYPWGLSLTGSISLTGVAVNSLKTGGANRILAVPQYLPKGIIRRILYGVAAAPVAGSRSRMAIWSVKGGTGTDNLYPGSRLWDSGEQLADAANRLIGNETTIAIETPGIYYLGINFNTTAGTQVVSATTISAYRYGLMGMSVRYGNGEPNYNDSLTVGHSHAHAFGTELPDPFPSSAPSKLVYTSTGSSVDMPLMYFGFDPA